MKATMSFAMVVGLGLMLVSPAVAAYDPGKVQGGGCYAELFEAPTSTVGGYEYVIDFYSDGGGSQDYAFWGFDNAQVANTWSAFGKTLPRHFWTFMASYDQSQSQLQAPSVGGLYTFTPDGGTQVWGGDDSWTLSAYDWAMTNPWHLPSEYSGSWGAWNGLIGPEGEHYVEAGGPYWEPAWTWAEKNKLTDTFDTGVTYDSVQGGQGTCSEDMMYVKNISAVWGHGEGLMWTMRIVTPEVLVEGDLTWSMPSYGAGHLDGGLYDVLWVENEVTGDFDGDGDVDDDDIDILCANMGSLDLATYDLDGSGVVDEDDMIFHVETLVEYDTDGNGTPDGVGTYRGDFNLDGVVNATDLQIMKGNFGSSGVGFAAGNANCDTVVNATDLQILKGTFGSAASAVPEPLTIGLLAVGGAALLRRRK